MFFILATLWFIRETKAILFYLYLWQLKEYHIGRFLDHFRTEKGKQLIFNKLLILKIFLIPIFLCGFFLFSFKVLPPPVFSQNLIFIFKLFVGIPFLVLILYIFEAVHVSFGFFQRKLKKPVWTLKTILLISVAVILEILFVFALFLYLRDEWGQINFTLGTFYLLLFDILTPVITSAIVLIFQPLAVLSRNQIIRKAKKKRAQFKDLIVIGITGSYGKTSTKEFLATILSEKFKVLKTAKHQNSEVGVSLCILNDLKPEHEIFIVEMGAYNRGGIKLLCDIIKPKIGVLTGINEQHMATFGSLENIIKAKYELIESLPRSESESSLLRGLPENGLAIFNGDNDYCYELYKKTKKPKKVYSLQSTISNLPVDLYTSSIAVNREFLSFKVIDKNGESAIFKANLLGEQNISNILASAVCAKELGMTLEEITKACQKIESWQGGVELKKGINGLNIIDATYSANPDGVISHIDYLKIWPGKKVIIMPCLIELGKVSKRIHKEIGKKIGEVCDLSIITTREHFQEIGEGATEKGLKGENILFIENPKEIFEKIKNSFQAGDVALLESRVPSQLINLLIP